MSHGLTAYIRDNKVQRTLTVREGDLLNEFMVSKVDEQCVILDLDGVEVRLSY